MVNVDLREMLAGRADSVDVPTFDPAVAMARGDGLVRRRRRLVTGGVAVAVAGALGLTALVTDPADRPLPSEPVPVPEWTPGTRPLSYGQGQTLHLGHLEIDTGMDFLTIDLTDDGAALTTMDGGIWFTDGTTLERIGTTLGVKRISPRSLSWSASRPPDWVVGDTAGSLLAWLEFKGQRADQPELVVYDTSTGALTARQQVEVADGNSATIVALAERAVFVNEDERGHEAAVPSARYDVDSGSLDAISGKDLSSAVRGVPRALAVGPVGNGRVIGAPAPRLGGPPMTERLDVTGSVIEYLHDPASGEGVEITVPEGSEFQNLWFIQWLDDDSFVASTYIGKPTGHLLLCRISAGRCDVVVDSATWRVDALLPGPNNVGSELALDRAIDGYQRQRR
jgi:hypothetical protein